MAALMRRKHQLELPGLRRREPRPPAGAQRDFTESEFQRALARNRFRQTGDFVFEDVELGRMAVVSVVRRDPVRLDRRATLAGLLRFRANVYRQVRKVQRHHRQRLLKGDGGTSSEPRVRIASESLLG